MKNQFSVSNFDTFVINNPPQLPRAVTEFKKMFKQYGYYPKFLHWSGIKMCPQSKFFKQMQFLGIYLVKLSPILGGNY